MSGGDPLSGVRVAIPARRGRVDGSARWLTPLVLAGVAVVLTVALSGRPALAYPTTQRPLTACDFTAARIGWAVGDKEVVIRTVTGGRLWHRQRSGGVSGARLRDVSFADHYHGWIVGRGGVVLATTNAGGVWQRQDAGVAADWRGVVAVALEEAVAVGWTGSGDDVTGTIVRTDDGGASWEVTASLPGVRLHDVDFSDELRGWAVGSRIVDVAGSDDQQALLLETLDGGLTWSERGGPDALGFEETSSSTLFAVESRGTTRVWCAGRLGPIGAARGFVARSTDGGATWQTMRSGRFTSFRGISFGSSTRGCVVGIGAGSQVVRTKNGGETWQRRALPAGTRARAVDMVSGTHGWVVGDASGHKGLVARTTDGGATWSRRR